MIYGLCMIDGYYHCLQHLIIVSVSISAENLEDDGYCYKKLHQRPNLFRSLLVSIDAD